MSAATWIGAAAELCRALAAEKAPAWVSPEAAEAAREAAKLLRRDVLRAVDAATREAAAAALGVRREPLQRWLAAGGWLHRPRVEKRPRGRRPADAS